MHLPKPNDAQFELPPAGTHIAVCYRIIDLGTQAGSYAGKPNQKHKILVSWELPDEKMQDGRPFTVSQRYTWSMSEKAALRRDLESWRGRPFTDADFGDGGFNIKNILGVGCLLTIVHTEKNAEGKQYANIKGIAKLMKGMTTPPLSNESVYLWIAHGHWSADTFHKLSDGLKQAIMSSPEYRELVNGVDEPPPIEADHTEELEPIPF